MDERGFRTWLERGGLKESSVQTHITDAMRVERHYGDLEALYRKDRFDEVLQELRYTAEDERRGTSNPSRLPIQPRVRSNYSVLSSYAVTVRKYRDLLDARTAGMNPDAGSRAQRGCADEQGAS